MEKIHLSSILLTFLGSMRAFWKFPHLGPLAQDWKKWPLNEIFQSFWSVKYIVGFLLLRRNRSWQETLHFLNIGQGKALSMLIYRPYLIVWWYKLILSLPHRKGIGHTIRSFPLNFKNVWDAESTAIRGCFR